MTGEAEHLFILVGYLYVCFGKMSLQIPSLHFNCFFFFFFCCWCWVVWVPYMFWILAPYSIQDLQDFLVVHCIGICLPMQGSWVLSLVWKDSTCRGATKPRYHNYWAPALGSASRSCWACVLQLPKPARLEPVLCNKRSHHNEEPVQCSRAAPTGCNQGEPAQSNTPARPKVNK